MENPINIHDKALSVSNVERALKRLLIDVEDPLLIGINGRWGEGKTF
jgi:hypothetical protein